MQKKYGLDKGFLLVALSDEPDTTVRPFVKKNSMNYVVGSDAKSTFGEFGIRGYPTIFVLNPSGEIVYKGHSPPEAEDAVEEAFKKTPPKAKPLGEASGDAALKRADDLAAKKEFAKALSEYDKIAKAQKNSALGRKAKAKADEIRKNPEAMAAVRNAETRNNCENWLQLARNLVSAGKEEEAAKYYKKILDQYPDSSYAETAKREMAKL